MPLRPYAPPQDLLRLLRSILGPFLTELWLAETAELVSGDTDKWRGMIKRAVLPAVGAARPAFAIDGSHFGGKKVVQTATSGTKVLWANNTLSGVAAAGSMPVLLTRFRLRTSTGTQRILGFGGSSGRSVEMLLNGGSYRFSDITTQTISSAAAPDTAVHTLVGYSDATRLHARVDGVDSSGIATTTLQNAATFGSVGAFSFDGSSSAADLSCAAIALLLGDPGLARLVAAENAIAAYYPA